MHISYEQNGRALQNMDRSMPTVLIIIFHLETKFYNISQKHVNVEIYVQNTRYLSHNLNISLSKLYHYGDKNKIPEYIYIF